MKTPGALLCAFTLLGAVACDGQDTATPAAAPQSPTSRPAVAASAVESLTKEELVAVWPETGSKVYETFDLLVGPSARQVAGQLAVLTTGEALAKGQAAPGGAILLTVGENSGPVNLPVGKHRCVVQWLDAAGKSLGPDHSVAVDYEVVQQPRPHRVTWLAPADGATVKRKFQVKFGNDGVGVAPADENVLDAAKRTGLDKTFGHHHILVNKPAMPIGASIPKDALHIHYGKGQTEAEVELAPGDYTLTMQLADANHRSYGPRLAATIKVKVVE